MIDAWATSQSFIFILFHKIKIMMASASCNQSFHWIKHIKWIQTLNANGLWAALMTHSFDVNEFVCFDEMGCECISDKRRHHWLNLWNKLNQLWLAASAMHEVLLFHWIEFHTFNLSGLWAALMTQFNSMMKWKKWMFLS